MFEIRYHHVVVEEDIPRLAPTWKKKIKRAVGEKLATRPDAFGKPLRRSLRGYRKLRVGDYRVIYRIKAKRVIIFVIQHRSVVYNITKKRI